MLVDWDTAGQSDPFIDVGQLGVFAFPNQREAFLEAYLGRPANEEDVARSLLGRVVALAFYALSFRNVQMLAGEKVPPDAPEPTLAEVFAALATKRERMSPGLLARALQREMRETLASDAFAAAEARLEP